MKNSGLPQEVFHGTTDLQHASLSKGIDVNAKGANTRPDFGPGFYTTSNYQQAMNQAMRKANVANIQQKRLGSNKLVRPIVFVYDLLMDPEKLHMCKIFASPDEEWGNFVLTNRTHTLYTQEHNINQRIPMVYGPLADGIPNIAVLLDELKRNTITLEEARLGLIPEDFGNKSQNQLSFHTPEAANMLKFRNIRR